jgi:hypothetical protein
MLAIIRFVVDNYENSDCSPLLDALIEWLFVNHDSGSGDCLLYLSAMLKYGGDLLSSRLGYFNLSRAIDIQAINRLEKSIMPPSPSSLDKFQQSFLKRRLQTRRAS